VTRLSDHYSLLTYSLSTVTDFQEQFRKKRRTFWLLTAALLILICVRYFTTPVEAAPAGADDFIFIGGLAMIALYSWLLFRCPSCRASLPQTFALPWRRECVCRECGVRLGE